MAYVYPEDIPRALQVMRGAKETGKDAVIEARIVTRAGGELCQNQFSVIHVS
ncbi:hypothetical protein BEI61_04461 [Eisenbergiella tayi]|uniref:Uncharacterized protein n=2 Tax=Eisenbergiella tayi TaxID=1432052 RepID=A0A1E3A4H8_9FIRM|nr:hypothetical protein BEI61_04461 [Eisenbergiella tayi]